MEKELLNNKENKKDFLKIDIITKSDLIIKMTITHIQSGITVSGEGTKRYLLKDQLLEKLNNLLSAKN